MPSPTLKAKATLDDSQFNRKMTGLVTRAKKAGAVIGRATMGVGRVGIAGGAAAGLGGVMLVRNTIKNTDALYRMSKMSGVAVRDLAVLQDVFEENAGDLDTLSRALKYMEKNLSEASKGGTPLAKALSVMGMSVKEFTKEKPADQFIALAKSIVGLKTPLERAHAAQAAFGRQGIELIPILHAVAETDFSALNQEADAIAGMAEQMHQLNVQTKRTEDAIGQAGLGIAQGLAPAITAINDLTQKGSFLDWGRKVGRFFSGVAQSTGLVNGADLRNADSPASDRALWLGLKNKKIGADFSGIDDVGASDAAKKAIAKTLAGMGTPGSKAASAFRNFSTASFKGSLGSSGGLKTGSLPTGSLTGGTGNPLGVGAFNKVRRGDAARAKAEKQTKMEDDVHSILGVLQELKQ